jgi:choline dehydrogenase
VPNAHRKNLTVAVSALVHKVVLEGASGEVTATGVEVSSAGKSFVIKAEKEVILSTGSVKFPAFSER